MIKLVAFDWNGTILSDTNAVVAADNAVLNHFGLPETNLKQVQETFRMPIRDFWIAMGLDTKYFDEDPDVVFKVFMETYEPLEQVSRTRSGAKEILSWLKDQEITPIVFSNHIVEHIEKQLARLGIKNFIDVVLARTIGDNSHLLNKTKDIKLNDYITKNSINSHEVLVVGDTEEEIEIAKKFGYISVALTGGNVSTKRLKAIKPDYLINNLIELKEIIAKI